ncbi:MAG: hypothetical protein DMF68_19745 [Acidobacteria bacterium]|nr:MAG: hypothetical protein DMF68_19745 [Acidobacteriota bacterium]
MQPLTLSGRTVLVTGGTGFIGTHLVRRLLKDSTIRLVLLYRSAAAEKYEGVTHITASLDRLSPETWLGEGIDRIDFLFHLAAFTPKTREQGDLVEEVYRDNLLGTRSLLESLPAPPMRIIFSSTLDVYDALTGDSVLTESSPLRPSNLYAASKLFCEQLVRSYARLHNCGYSILRYGHIFGPGEEVYGKLIPQTIKQILSGKSPVIYGDGSAERDLLYVTDAVEATLRAATSVAPELGPLNIVRGESTSIRRIVEILMAALNHSGRIQYVNNDAPGTSFRFDNGLMRRELGEWNLVPLEEGLKEESLYFQGLNL